MNKRTFITILMLLILAGCGFHLRGSRPGTSETFEGSIYLTQNRADDIAAAVRSQLRTADTRLVGTPEEADYTLLLSDERIRRSVLSVSANTGRAEEYQLTLTLSLSLTAADGSNLIEQETLQLERDYALDQDAVLGSFSEEQVIREEMLERAAAQILQRLIAATR